MSRSTLSLALGLLCVAGCDAVAPDAPSLTGAIPPVSPGDTDAGGSTDAPDTSGSDGDGTTTGARPDADDDGSSGGSDDDAGAPPFPDLGSPADPIEPGCDAIPQILLVLDKSASMDHYKWNHDGDYGTPRVSRWSTLVEAVERTVDELDGLADVGMLLFPGIDADQDGGAAQACLLDDAPHVPVGSETAHSIVDALPQGEVGGGTPTRRAIEQAVAHLGTLDATRPRAIVLVTDGSSNCDGSEAWLETYDPLAVDAVADAWAQGIPTFVVGVDIENQPDAFSGKNVRDAINELALAGGVSAPGVDAFYNVRDAATLEQALATVTDATFCFEPAG
ncbi:MAG: VWA domain-containing protein [Myxococcota bacterium]